MDSAPKKLDAVDKWRARVMFRDPLPATDSWGKRMERQMAVLRVSFPFLTEKQLRGKAWTACGLHSLMGELPRSGLSPQVKKEFTKRGKDIRLAMSPKLKIKKEPNAVEKKEPELSTYSYQLDNLGTEILFPPNNIISIAPSQTPLNSLNPANLLPINETGILSINNYDSLKKRREKRKLKPKRVDFDTLENSSLKSIVVPEISEVSWKDVNSKVRYKDPYCSQISKEKTEILQTLDRYTPETVTISECSTATQPETAKNSSSQSMSLISDHCNDPKLVEQCDILQQSQLDSPCAKELQNTQKTNQLFNIDSGSTFFECNLPATPENYWSNPMVSKELAYESTPVKSANIEESTIIFKDFVEAHQMDEKSLESQQVIENSSADSLSKNSNTDLSSNKVIINGDLLTEGSQSCSSINDSQTVDGIPFILSQNYSLPSTPQEPSMNHPLLSNLCCEYSKACSKEEYKPVLYVNSNNVIRKLKEDFDQIIPPEVSLMKYFEAEEKSFKQIQSEVHEKVNTIILRLEEDNSTETSKIDN